MPLDSLKLLEDMRAAAEKIHTITAARTLLALVDELERGADPPGDAP